MSTSEFSKLMIARGMKELLKTAPLEAVSIGDLAKRCQVSRSTIYYHFKDKYDIVRWIFQSEINPMVCSDRAAGDWTDNLMTMCQYMQRNREFYTKVLQDGSQNIFYQSIVDFSQDLIQHMLLESERGSRLSQEEITMVSRIYSYGIAGMLAQWSRKGMEADPGIFVKTTKDLISGDIFEPHEHA